MKSLNHSPKRMFSHHDPRAPCPGVSLSRSISAKHRPRARLDQESAHPNARSQKIRGSQVVSRPLIFWQPIAGVERRGKARVRTCYAVALVKPGHVQIE